MGLGFRSTQPTVVSDVYRASALNVYRIPQPGNSTVKQDNSSAHWSDVCWHFEKRYHFRRQLEAILLPEQFFRSFSARIEITRP